MTLEVPRETLEVRGDPAAHLSLNLGGDLPVKLLLPRVAFLPHSGSHRPVKSSTERATGLVNDTRQGVRVVRGPGR